MFAIEKNSGAIDKLKYSRLYGISQDIFYLVIKANCQNPMQLNSTQNNSKATSFGVRHSSQVFHPPHPTRACHTEVLFEKFQK